MSDKPRDFYESFLKILGKYKISEDEISAAGYGFLEALAGRRSDEDLPAPFRHATAVLYREFDAANQDRQAAFTALQKHLENPQYDQQAVAEALWKALFPEALYAGQSADKQIKTLRENRKIRIDSLCADPIGSVGDEILFTSNVLLTLPVDEDGGLSSNSRDSVVRAAAKVRREPQKYWYDHPLPIGIPVANDELVYGLSGLSDALNFEKKRGNAQPDDRLTVCLSVSVTHEGLHEYAKKWLKTQLSAIDDEHLSGLDVFAFCESDTEQIIDILKPWMDNPDDALLLHNAFGVDGEYGRHYSFLKALAALWAILEDPKIKATFKIDLDQVFPQDVLAAETGMSAFEHLCTPLWGAQAVDAEGKNVELGMIAGALVNEKDIAAGLFTPDIPWPSDLPEGEDLVFFKQCPMAVSTRAEMMTRYGREYDGKSTAIQRIHVTGGTNGIRLDALRRHQPFTPGFIGRAEDQGYLLSVLTPHSRLPSLRYAHASGLIMRHDKEVFAGSAMKAGKSGSYVGDLVRLFVFSAYAGIISNHPEQLKKLLDPFTGCFITPMPATLALLRLALHLMSGKSPSSRKDVLQLSARRLDGWVNNFDEKKRWMKEAWQREKKGWNQYYKALDRLEIGMRNGEKEALDTAKKFHQLVLRCKISL